MSVNSTVASTRLARGARPDPGQELLDVAQDQLRGLPGQRAVGAGQLDQPGVGDVLGQVAAVLDREELEVPAVQHQRRRLDQREQRPDVHLEQGPQEDVDGAGAGDRALDPGHPAPEPLVTGPAGDALGHPPTGPPGLLDPGDHGLGLLG
jgi:hypothetical protein